MELEGKLNRKVDVITYNSVNPLLKDNIKRDEIKLVWNTAKKDIPKLEKKIKKILGT